MQVVNLLDFRTVGGERHPHRVLLAAIPAHRRVVAVRARVDDAVGRITFRAEERSAGIVAEGDLEDSHPRQSEIIAELIDFVASSPPCASIVLRPGVEPCPAQLLPHPRQYWASIQSTPWQKASTWSSQHRVRSQALALQRVSEASWNNHPWEIQPLPVGPKRLDRQLRPRIPPLKLLTLLRPTTTAPPRRVSPGAVQQRGPNPGH